MRIVFFIHISVCLALGSEVYIDTKTELIWQDNSASRYIKKDWQGALAFCSDLRLSGHDDWRLPVIKELIQIVSADPRDGGIKEGFKNVGASGYYWSSSAHESSEDFAWMMNFKRGYEYSNYKTYERHVRCVRDTNETR